MEKPICRECKLMRAEFPNGGRNIFYCYHPNAKTECLPHRIISRSREKQIQSKRAPRWCPLKQEGK